MTKMTDYAAMYKRLFQAQTSAIELLQKAQQDTEEIYINTSAPKGEVSGKKNADMLYISG